MPDSENTAQDKDLTKNNAETPAAFMGGILRFRRPVIILTYVTAFTAAMALAFLFAFKMAFLRRWVIYPFPLFLFFSLLVKLIVFGRFGQYQGWWRYVGISDLIGIVKASFAGTLILFCLWWAYIFIDFDFLLKDADRAINNDLKQIQDTYKTTVSDAETKKLRRRWHDLRGLYDLIEVGRIRQIQKQIEQIPDKTKSKEAQIRLLQIAGLRRTFDVILLFDFVTTVVILGGLRMVVRLYHEEYFTESHGGLKRFLIVGGGDAGEALLREIVRIKKEQYDVIGFIDDDPAKQGVSIHGISVMGTVEQLPQICQKEKIDEIAIAIPSATPKELRRVVQICQGAKIRFRTVPSITDIASGKLKVSQIRDVDIDDLLGREVVQLDLDLIEKFLKNKIILITGSGGSIGSEMCRQVCNFDPKKLLLVEQAENPLFYIDRELSKSFPQVATEALVCDITNKGRLEYIFQKYRPEVVIHAAAHKHVPLMETNPGEAVKNNIVGTRNVSDLADAYGATDFVMISTDKAVNPTSIMGSSKRVAEMYIQDLNNTSETHFVTVRFGNVLGSEGSVVPIFNKQIAAGGPVTVTHPEMKRYFMTIPEASQLVLQAATMGQGGEIFVLDMGEPVKIVDLAKELITLSGFRPGEDIEIAFIGLRPGEKLFEELSIAGEDMLATRHSKIAAWKNIPKDRQTLRSEINKLVEVATTQDYDKIVESIKQLVPEYIGDKTNSG
ncbi:MAG: polysaccharide biosynthesis protein [Planctomycetota bacterium]|jgi:FlaA1/EpsC-like NDP-sugar epimerase